MMLPSMVRAALLTAAAFAVACSSGGSTSTGDGVADRDALAASPHGAASARPRTLSGEARAIMQRLIEVHDDPERADFRTPGTVTNATGEKIAYDRYLVVGSTLTQDRGSAFAQFILDLRANGGDFVTITQREEEISKVLVRYDDQRFVVAVGQW